MSVLIKTMEMPKNCGECQFCHTENFTQWCCPTGREDVSYDSIPEWCPLDEPKTGEWIPVSERLPDKTGWYVVTVAGLETITDMLVFYNEVSAWSDITDKQKVVAWMPLPEPYKGGDDE